jgi:hypothetical protein
MSICLTLYVISKKDFDDEVLCPTHILYLGKTSLIDYFISGDGAEHTKEVEKDKNLWVLTCDDELPNPVNSDSYGDKLKYISSLQFSSIPKSILKEENKTVKSVVKFIKKIPESIVILYYR